MDADREGCRRASRGPLVARAGEVEGGGKMSSEDAAEELEGGIGAGESCTSPVGKAGGSTRPAVEREGVNSDSEAVRPPSLAMLPVSTFMDDTDIAPGVRGSGGRRFVNCLSSEGRGESEVGGITLVDGVDEGSYVDPARLPDGVLDLLPASPDPALPASLAVLAPIFPVETLLDGLTTSNGTDALPAPRLATLGFSAPFALNPEGRLGACPKDPPEGRRGLPSALT